MTIQHVRKLRDLQGHRLRAGNSAEVCPECHGSGQVRMQRQTMFGTMATSTVCPNCRGEGKIIHQKCRPAAAPAACAGDKRSRRQKFLRVSTMARPFPSGVRATAGRNGGPAGDLIVGINVTPHPRLRREGPHIYLDQTVSILQATLGGEVEIPSLDGKIMCKIEPGHPAGDDPAPAGQRRAQPERPGTRRPVRHHPGGDPPQPQRGAEGRAGASLQRPWASTPA